MNEIYIFLVIGLVTTVLGHCIQSRCSRIVTPCLELDRVVLDNNSRGQDTTIENNVISPHVVAGAVN
jgi:hypothetical protein